MLITQFIWKLQYEHSETSANLIYNHNHRKSNKTSVTSQLEKFDKAAKIV